MKGILFETIDIESIGLSSDSGIYKESKKILIPEHRLFLIPISKGYHYEFLSEEFVNDILKQLEKNDYEFIRNLGEIDIPDHVINLICAQRKTKKTNKKWQFWK